MSTQGDSLRLEQQLRLQQRLNPQSVALGRVLEMSEPEFEDEVRRELDDNPALEACEPHECEHGDEEGYKESSEQLQRADYGDDDDTPLYLSASNADPDRRHVEAASIAPDEGESMGETLMRRLATESELGEDDMHTAAYIIGNLDSNGYMTRRLTDIATDIAMTDGREPDDEEMRRVFEAVRNLEPAGIGPSTSATVFCCNSNAARPTATPRRPNESYRTFSISTPSVTSTAFKPRSA